MEIRGLVSKPAEVGYATVQDYKVTIIVNQEGSNGGEITFDAEEWFNIMQCVLTQSWFNDGTVDSTEVFTR